MNQIIFRIFLCFVIFPSMASARQETVKVINFLETPECAKDNTVRLILPIKEINAKTTKEMTICFRFNMTFLKNYFMLTFGSQHYLGISNHDSKVGFIGFKERAWMLQWEEEMEPDEWHHICYSFLDNR